MKEDEKKLSSMKTEISAMQHVTCSITMQSIQKKEIFRGAEWLNTNHPNNLMALAVVKHPRDYCKILQLIRNFMYSMVVQEIEIF